MVEVLEASDTPVPKNTLFKKATGGTTRSQGISAIKRLQYYDTRVFECDNGSIGLLGKHDGDELEETYREVTYAKRIQGPHRIT